MKQLIFFTIILLTHLGFAQNKIPKKIMESTDFQNREHLDSIAKTLNHKIGDDIKIYLLFNTDEKGNVAKLEARSIHPAFEEEAIRIFNDLELAKLVQKESKAKSESRRYALPIIYTMETEKEKKRRHRKEKRKLKKK